MSFSTWLRYWKRSLERRSALHQIRRPRPAARRRTRRLHLEVLEDRTLLSSFTEFPVPTSSSLPGGITKGPDGNLWFTEDNGNKIGRITPAGGITEFAISAGPWGITAGPDGNMWFSTQGNQVGRITPSGTTTLFPILPGSADYGAITTGPDGNLWVTEGYNNQIAVVSPQGVLLNQFNIPISGGVVEDITAGPDGNLWFTDIVGPNGPNGPVGTAYVGNVSVNGNFTIYQLAGTSNSVKGITTGPDGNLWFVEQATNKIGRMTPSGTLTEFSIPTPNSNADTLTIGSDGNLWFEEYSANQIARITPSGVITEYPVPTPNSGPWDIATGPDGNLWFTEHTANQIGRYVLGGPQLTVNSLTVSGSNGAVVSNSGTFADTTAGATITAMSTSVGTVVQNNSNGTWSWSYTTPAGSPQPASVIITATDSAGKSTTAEFGLNVAQVVNGTQVFYVTTGVDNGNDLNPTVGSLRWAILASNQTPGTATNPDRIDFDIPTTDPSYNSSNGSFDVITPAQENTIHNLPDLTAPVIIDGYTQPGAQVNTLARGDNAVLKIVLNGTPVVSDGTQQNLAGGGPAGLNLIGGNTTIRGLVISNFGTGFNFIGSGTGISISSNNNIIEGNYIGTDVTGEQAQGNGSTGVGLSSAAYNQIGMRGNGAGDFADRNIISANGNSSLVTEAGSGVRLSDASYNVVAGNYIGTDASGTLPRGNFWGVLVTLARRGTTRSVATGRAT